MWKNTDSARFSWKGLKTGHNRITERPGASAAPSNSRSEAEGEIQRFSKKEFKRGEMQSKTPISQYLHSPWDGQLVTNGQLIMKL